MEAKGQGTIVDYLGKCRTLWGKHEQMALNCCTAKALPVKYISDHSTLYCLQQLRESITIAEDSLLWSGIPIWAIAFNMITLLRMTVLSCMKIHSIEPVACSAQADCGHLQSTGKL